jgi:hypothetical protein
MTVFYFTTRSSTSPPYTTSMDATFRPMRLPVGASVTGQRH